MCAHSGEKIAFPGVRISVDILSILSKSLITNELAERVDLTACKTGCVKNRDRGSSLPPSEAPDFQFGSIIKIIVLLKNRNMWQYVAPLNNNGE